MKPIYHVVIDGKDISTAIQSRLISLTITDNRAFEADQFDLVLSDHDGSVALPRRGVTATVAIGWESKGKRTLVDKGSYTVDEVSHSGPPDLITIRGRSVNFRDGFKTKRDKSYKNKTLGDIVNSIASRHDLKGQIADTLSAVTIEHIDQANESDGHFLTRLAARYDALLNIKNNNLLFMPQGQGQSVSGAHLDPITIHRSQTTEHDYNAVDRQAHYTGATAKWWDSTEGKIKKEIAGDDKTTKRISTKFSTQDEAKASAQAEWQKIQRSQAGMSITLARGRSEVLTETPITLQGWNKPEIDDGKWIVERATHSLSDSSGFTSVIFIVFKAS